MRVCIASHCFPPTQGAAQLYIGGLARKLARQGIKVRVATVAFSQNAPATEEMDGVIVHRIPNPLPYNFKNFGFMGNVSTLLGRIWEEEPFDVLHSEHVFPLPSGGVFAARKGIPHVGVIEGISRVSLYSKLVYLTHRYYLPRSRYTTLVGWSRFLVERYFKKWGIHEDKVRVIPGAVDIRQFNPQVDGSRIRRALLGGRHSKIVLTAKPLYHTNALGIRYVLKAMKEVVRKHRDAVLIVAGDGRKKKELQGLARSLGLGEHARFIGWVPQHELPRYYAAADVIVDSIVYSHAGSVTVMESLASGRPNVLCDIECLPGEESFPSRDIAVLVRPMDPVSMAEGIVRLLEDQGHGRAIGRSAWKYVSRNFSMDTVASRYRELYEELTA